MTSLTTLFVVGPNEYVEFNESWGSKAFLHHIWDQSQTPLQAKDLAQGRLHSAGARISKSKPPRIEFPIVLRVKGKGSTYTPTGKWLSWDELAKRNPLAVKPPPSLDDFIAAGATVGTGPQLNPGQFASQQDPIQSIKPPSFKQPAKPTAKVAPKPAVMTKAKTPAIDLETDEDGWIGGASQSIYAPKQESHASPPPTSRSAHKPSPKTPARKSSSPASDTKSRSLLERMEMAQNFTTPPPSSSKPRHADAQDRHDAEVSPSDASSTSPFRTTPSQGIRRPGAKLPSPLPLTSPARNNQLHSPSNTRTPLSASHPIPETPLKLSQRGGPQTPATPHYPIYPHSSHYHQDGDAARASGLGLGLTPLRTPIPLAQSPDGVKSPLSEALNLRGRAGSNAGSIGSPLKQGRSDLHGEPLALHSSKAAGAGHGQIDVMLDRLRNTRSGLGTSASMWAPKPSDSSSASTSTSTTSHTIGSGFSSSNMLGVQTGLDRKRPSHRPNGLQLSLGQEISVMQELDEKAEEDYASSHLSSASVAETFRIDPPDHEDGNEDAPSTGTVVPPTPSLGCDSPPSSPDEGKCASRSLDAFGWGKPGNSNGKSSLFSKLPSSSTLEANWSGDDDDEKKNDMEVFEDMHRAAKASNKDKRNNSSFAPLPPPPINFGQKRSPSPSPSSAHDGGGVGGEKLSPKSARSQLQSEDSDGDDADVENDRNRDRGTKRERKPAKKAEEGAKENNNSGLQVDHAAAAAGLEKKRSLKRDKSERIRGCRSSQSKDKDVDSKIKVGLPTGEFAKRDREDDLASEVGRVTLEEKVKPSPVPTPVKAISGKFDAQQQQQQQQTPVAQRVQSIPTVKDDLFSSPAEPKVGLPTAKVEPAPAEERKEEEKEEKEELMEKKTPETSHAKSMSFDWAADDDELDDELPDLDDWGVTLTPAKPAPVVEEKKEKEKEGKGVWRRGGSAEAPTAPAASRAKGKPDKAAGKGASIKGAACAAGKNDYLGNRIAGRAKEASLSPEPESAGKKSLPAPASTPYGRWNKASSAATSKEEEVHFKGGGARKAPPPTGRPRPDLGSLAKLLAPEDGGGGGGGKPESRSRKSSPALDKGDEWARRSTPPSVKDSIHAPPSVADSMHAPKNRTPNIPTGPKAAFGAGSGAGAGKKKPHTRK